MGEVLRDLARIAARWALWSPKHAALTLVGVLVLLVAVGAVTRSPHHPAAVAGTPTPTVSSAATVTAPATITAGPTGTPTATPRLTAVEPAAVSVATRFAAAWVAGGSPTGTAARWVATMRGVATPCLLARLATTAPGNVPARRVLGPPRYVSSADGRLMLSVQTDTYLVLLTLIRPWLVDSVDVSLP